MDGIIFDVDGTLWDSVEVVAESWNLARQWMKLLPEFFPISIRTLEEN